MPDVAFVLLFAALNNYESHTAGNREPVLTNSLSLSDKIPIYG
jgi:hypothetical protein